MEPSVKCIALRGKEHVRFATLVHTQLWTFKHVPIHLITIHVSFILFISICQSFNSSFIYLLISFVLYLIILISIHLSILFISACFFFYLISDRFLFFFPFWKTFFPTIPLTSIISLFLTVDISDHIHQFIDRTIYPFVSINAILFLNFYPFIRFYTYLLILFAYIYHSYSVHI